MFPILPAAFARTRAFPAAAVLPAWPCAPVWHPYQWSRSPAMGWSGSHPGPAAQTAGACPAGSGFAAGRWRGQRPDHRPGQGRRPAPAAPLPFHTIPGWSMLLSPFCHSLCSRRAAHAKSSGNRMADCGILRESIPSENRGYYKCIKASFLIWAASWWILIPKPIW